MLLLIDILTSILAFSYFIIAGSFIIGWQRIRKPSANRGTHTTKVSVIIPARNEEKMIGKCVNDIVAQNYPNELLEIIVIDDHSTDSTADVVKSIQYPNLKLIKLQADPAVNSYKKKAIADAISIASGDLIVTTDGDCRMGNNWIRSIVNEYEVTGNKMISSPVAYFEERSFFEKLQSLEFMCLISLGAASIANKMAGSCNGANLAYEKKAFFEVGGFSGIDHIASGDDELLLHKMLSAYHGKVSFLKSREAVVYTHAKPTLKDFISQRRRWASKSTKYKNKWMVGIGVSVFFYYVALLLTGLIGLFVPSIGCLFLGAFVFKCLIDLIWVLPVAVFLRKLNLIIYFPILAFLHLFYIVYIGLAGQAKQYEWKGRMVQ
ncbi:glycosyltransferase family 2 protein [Solitalea canadensis]|uniref:Glycosyl transferase n=1 Tax=Solitalea canadensis (strain ATCC 29591 / DSM 3403 / JCM 21819 / LMG 8368 / NBRC 15130 / NCIMB 12057 / USAM 9D) TaxID=929556 RepID=H8KWQ8_SOLCM|nr:glycosyltransferase [Solitalea canadensis]AFD08237.1 glycosyl transferase [Solitalea canadensis DSM 3403]